MHEIYKCLGDDIIYVYPDMETVLVGRFEGGSMKGARKSKIIAERCNKGIKEIKVAKPKVKSPFLSYDRPNTIRVGANPTVIDPFEQKNVYLRTGKFGDYIVAKKNFSEGDLIMFYTGLMHNKTESRFFSPNQTRDEM